MVGHYFLTVLHIDRLKNFLTALYILLMKYTLYTSIKNSRPIFYVTSHLLPIKENGVIKINTPDFRAF